MADTTVWIASALKKHPHIMALHDVVRDRLASLPAEAVLVYLIDFVAEDALYTLAEQFNVLGYKGYFLATTEAEKRAIIKRAIDLQRFKGTPWSIKEALREFGYPNVTILENTGSGPKYDGTYTHNGAIQHSGDYHWANFDVVFNMADYPAGFTADQQEQIYQIIMEYKNVRSNLRQLTFLVSQTENLTVSESAVAS
jgi:P2-related tail formation protein